MLPSFRSSDVRRVGVSTCGADIEIVGLAPSFVVFFAARLAVQSLFPKRGILCLGAAEKRCFEARVRSGSSSKGDLRFVSVLVIGRRSSGEWDFALVVIVKGLCCSYSLSLPLQWQLGCTLNVEFSNLLL